MNCNHKSIMTKKRAFTLIELLIVIAIIGILFIVLVSKVDFATDKAKASGVQTDFRSFQAALETVSKENAGFNTFGWDTGDNAGAAPAGYTYTNATKDAGDRIRNSYDEGDTNLNGTYDDGEVWTGRKVYTETWTGCYTLINPGDASDTSAIFDLETAINKNLDPKLHIVIADDGTISMANGLKDAWSTQYHGQYITNASADAAAKWNVDASMAGSTGDNMDRGAILMYSNGANQKFGTKVKIVGGVVTATVSQIDADHPDNNKMGADDYVLAVVYSYTNGYGETAAITEGFSNNQQFLTGNGSNTISPDDNNQSSESLIPKLSLDDYSWAELKQIANMNLSASDLSTTWNINLGDQKGQWDEATGNMYYYYLVDLGGLYDGFVFMVDTQTTGLMYDSSITLTESNVDLFTYKSSLLASKLELAYENLADVVLKNAIKEVNVDGNYLTTSNIYTTSAHFFIPSSSELTNGTADTRFDFFADDAEVLNRLQYFGSNYMTRTACGIFNNTMPMHYAIYQGYSDYFDGQIATDMVVCFVIG